MLVLNALDATNNIVEERIMDRCDEFDNNIHWNAADIINCVSDSNAMDESLLQHEKQFQPRMSTLLGIVTSDDSQKLRINL
jgi:hypothetical protein